MNENVLPFPRRLPRQEVAPSPVVGMLIFVVTELMLFAGFVSAFTITRAAYNTWPPVGQPRLPALATAFNTLALFGSGVALYYANRAFRRKADDARKPMLAALVLGGLFVAVQGVEWTRLLHAGLTLTSSNHGAFFYLIVGCHALHALAAIGALFAMYRRLLRGALTPAAFMATQIFWYFVVGVWPVLYLRVYL